MVQTAPAPPPTVAGGHQLMRRCSNSQPSVTNTAAAHPGSRRHCAISVLRCMRARAFDSRWQRLGQVDAGVGNGGVDGAHNRHLSARRTPRLRAGRSCSMQFQAARLQLMRGRVDLEVASAGGFSPDDHAGVAAALDAVGLDAELAKRTIDQLSGGEMRRVVLAGLLARSPRVLILDEPLAGLDAASRRDLVRLLADRRRETGLTIVVISHDFAGLEELCPRTLHLRDGLLEPAPGGAQPSGAALLPARAPDPSRESSRCAATPGARALRRARAVGWHETSYRIW